MEKAPTRAFSWLKVFNNVLYQEKAALYGHNLRKGSLEALPGRQQPRHHESVSGLGGGQHEVHRDVGAQARHPGLGLGSGQAPSVPRPLRPPPPVRLVPGPGLPGAGRAVHLAGEAALGGEQLLVLRLVVPGLGLQAGGVGGRAGRGHAVAVPNTAG